MKINLKKASLILAIVALGGILFGSVVLYGAGNAYDRKHGGNGSIDQEKTYAAAAIDSIEIATVSANVRWFETEGDQIKVHLYGQWYGGNRPQLVTSSHGNLLSVEVKHPRQFNIGFNFHAELTLDVYAPKSKWQELKIRTVSGDIRIASLSGRVIKFNTVSGDLAAGSVLGEDITLGTTSGDFRLDDCRGDLTYKSVSGCLEEAYAVYADDIYCESVSGEINLDLPEGAAFSLSANSLSGDLECAFPLAMHGGDEHHRLAGTVGAGGHEVSARTISGEIKIF